jgi:phosphatidyl-myo-inositol alpha-mannosyltransferase
VREATGARLRVIGADPGRVRTLLGELAVPEDGIDLLGPVPDRERDAELRTAALLTAPATGSESFGMVLLEAFARATPVVASAIDGYAELVRPGTGVLVPPSDPGALAAAVIDLIRDDARRAELGAGGRREAEQHYAWERVAERLERIYERLGRSR